MSRSWEAVFDDARERFGSEPFTVPEFVEVLRPYVNPMEAARLSDRSRVPHRPEAYDSRRKDDVAVGLAAMARQMLSSRTKSGSVERVGGGLFRVNCRASL